MPKIKIVTTLFLVWFAFAYWVLAPKYQSNYEYKRVELWLEASRCSAQTGKILVACGPDGNLIPIEDFSMADDRGHSLILGFSSALTGQPATLLGLVRINLAINAVAVLLGSLFLGGLHSRMSGLIFLLIGTLSLIPGPFAGPDVIGSYAGLTGLAVLSALTVYVALIRPLRLSLKISLIAVAYLTLGFVCLMRQPIGLSGVLASLAAIALAGGQFWNRRRRKFALALVPLALLFLTAKVWTPSLMQLRSSAYALPLGTKVLSHGLSHNLFIGLGTEKNIWGIVWSDDYAWERVLRKDPTIAYVSPEYYSILWGLYFESVSEAPIEAIRIYFKKALKVLSYKVSPLKIPLYLLLLLCLWLWRSLPEEKRTGDPSVWLIASTAMALSLTQGILSAPHRPILQGTDWIAFFFLSLSAGNYLAARPLRQRFSGLFGLVLKGK